MTIQKRRWLNRDWEFPFNTVTLKPGENDRDIYRASEGDYSYQIHVVSDDQVEAEFTRPYNVNPRGEFTDFENHTVTSLFNQNEVDGFGRGKWRWVPGGKERG